MRKSVTPCRMGILVLIALTAACVCAPAVFAGQNDERTTALTDEEKAILFTPEGIYRAPPALPYEVRENLSPWQLPDTELRLSEEKVLSTTLSDGSILLQNEWNFISFPKKMVSGYDTAGVVFAGVDTGGRRPLYYDSATQHWEAVYPETQLKPLVGYVIYSVGQCTINPWYYPASQQPNPYTNLYPAGTSSDSLTPWAMRRMIFSMLPWHGTRWLR